MADNVNDSLKNLNQNIKDADANLAKLSKDFNVVFTEAVNHAARDAKVSIDQMFDAIAGRVGASKASKLKLLFDIVDEHGKTATPQTIQQKIDRIVNATPNARGTKLHIGMDWVDVDTANANLRRYKEQLKLIQDMPAAYDLVNRAVNAIIGEFDKEAAAKQKIIEKNEKILEQEIAIEEKQRSKAAAQQQKQEEKQYKEEQKWYDAKAKADRENERRAGEAKYRQMSKEIAEYGKALQRQIELETKANQIRRDYNKIKSDLQGVSRQSEEYKKGQQVLQQYRQELHNVYQEQKKIDNEYKGTRSAVYNQQRINGLRQEYEQLRRNGRQIKENKSFLESMLPTLRRLASAFGVAFSVQGLVNFGKKLVETRGEFELQQVAMRSILKNKQLADEIWDKTMQAALQSPFTAMQLTKYTKQLAAYRIETDKLFDTTKRLADVSAGLGVDMQRLILAYGQVKAANYLRASEIRQFTEAGVNVLGELRDYFNEVKGMSVDTAKVMDMVQKRLVTFSDVEAIFKRMTDQGGIFYNMQYVQSQTVKGQINKLHDAYDQMLNSIGKANEGVIKDFVAALNNIVKNWRSWAVALKSIGWAAAIGFIVRTTRAMSGLGTASVGTLRRMASLKATILSFANAPTLVTAAITALVTTMIGLDNRMREANKQIDEQNLRLFESRNNFADLKSKIEENNKTIRENRSTTETLNKAQNDNRTIINKLKEEYPDLAEQMGIATNGIIEMNGAIDANIRKLNEQMTLISLMKQGGWLEDTGRENLEEFEADLSTITARLMTAQAAARTRMMNLEISGDTTSNEYQTLKKISELDLSSNILGARDAFLELAKSMGEYSDSWLQNTWFGRWAGKVQTVGKTNYKSMKSGFGIDIDDLFYPFDEKNVKAKLDELSVPLKEYYLNGIKDNEEYMKEVNEQYGGDIIKWITSNADKINQGTLDGINKANATLIKVLNPSTPAMREYINKYYNELWGLIDKAYLERLEQQITLKRSELMRNWTIGLQSEVDAMEAELERKRNGVDLTSTAEGKGTDGDETSEEKKSKIDAAWRRRINLLEEMKKRYDELSKSAYGYAKSESTVRGAFDESFKEIFKGTGISMSQIDFTSMQGMFASMRLVLQQARGISDAVREEIMKKIDSYEAQITINAQVRIREDFGRQMEEAFGNYDLTLELQKLNLPKGLAAEMWGIEETDLQDLRARLTEMYNGLRDENGQLYTDAFKDYEKFLDKIDDLERKQQRERLKDYAKYLETQYSDRVKIEMEYIQKLSRLEAETAIPEAQKEAIREGLRREFDEKSRKQDWEDFKGSEFYVEMMEDLEKQGTASLEVMRKKLLEMRANAENLSPRALKEVVNALEKIDEIERKRTQPLNRVREAQRALDGVNMKEVYEELAINQEQLALREEQERSMERAIMLIQKRNELEEQGYTIEEASVRLSQANQARGFAQSALDAFKSDGSKESQDNLATLEQVLNSAKADVEKWQEIVNILSGKAIIDEQAKGNEYTTFDLGELQERRKNLKQSIKDLEGVIGKEEELAKLNKELNDAWDATYEAIKGWASSVQNVFDGVMDNVDYFSDSTYGMVTAWKEFGDTSVSALNDLVSGIQAYRKANAEAEKNNAATGLFTANGLQLALVVLGVLMKIVQAIAKQHDAALDKQIQIQQERIDALRDAYARLERQIERTWNSVSYMQTYEQQVQNIREQISAMEAQMAAERDKKNTDDNAVRQYQRDIQDAYDQLEELEQKSIEVFGGIGEDGYRSAAEGFVEAWKSAFLETGDGLQGLQDHFDEFLQDWFVKQATMRIAGGMLEPVFRQIDAAVDKYGEGGTSAMLSEIERVRDMAAAIFPDLSLALEDLAGMFGVSGEGSLSGLAAGIQGMTEEQANILEAYWNSVRMYTASIDMNVSRIAEMLGAGSPNSNPMLQQMSLIAANTQATHQLLQSVTRSGHSLGGYGIKVFND